MNPKIERANKAESRGATAAPPFRRSTPADAAKLFLIFLLAAIGTARADRDVKFKAKVYEPRNSYNAKSYEAKPYSPNGGAVRAAPYSPGRAGSWKAREAGQAEPARPFQGSKGDAPAQLFTPRDPPSVKTFKTDPADIQERKPYEKKAPDLQANPFTPKAKDDGYNPMLTPRQGIKEEHVNGK